MIEKFLDNIIGILILILIMIVTYKISTIGNLRITGQDIIQKQNECSNGISLTYGFFLKCNN